MKKPNYLLIIVTIFFLSCEDNNCDCNLEVNIGESNGNVIVHKLNPPILIKHLNSDSIDLDGDSHYDLIFDKMPTPLLSGYGLKTEMRKKLGVQVVLSIVNAYPDTLAYLTNLNNQENWSDNSDETLILQNYLNRNENKIIGNFVIQEKKYLGVKMGTCFGWVKLTNDKLGALVIDEYAMMK